MSYLKNTKMENKNNNLIKLVTHSGSFHTDDVFAAAALSILMEKNDQEFEIIRTRDEKAIEEGHIVFDVGGVYDEEKNRFDHHQVGGAGKRENGIEYASLGLVWKKFGEEITGSKKVAEIIDRRLGAPIDAWDNGTDLVQSTHEAAPYFIQYAFFSMYPTWREEDRNMEEIFAKAVIMAKEILEREIIQATDMTLAEESVLSQYHNSLDKRIIILDKNYPFEFILSKFPEPIYAVYPRSDGSWGAKAIKSDIKTFNNRKDFPESWGGLTDEEFKNITGVSDALFCHRALYLCAAKSKEGAIKLAQIAVES
jgi:uncharacterized UPF0160 family protein